MFEQKLEHGRERASFKCNSYIILKKGWLNTHTGFCESTLMITEFFYISLSWGSNPSGPWSWTLTILTFTVQRLRLGGAMPPHHILGEFKNDRTFAIKTSLLILQHFKHCPLQSSSLYWRYTVPNVSSIVGMLPGTHVLWRRAVLSSHFPKSPLCH
jgi:hypothetical protein